MCGALVQLTAPASEPVTVAECKAHARIETADDDALISLYITAARQWAERTALWRTLVTTTFDYYLDCFPCDSQEAIELPRPPLSSVRSITYVDTSGTTQTWSASYYSVDTKSEPGRVMPAYGQAWPVTRRQMNAVTIEYEAGYGTASYVPESIKTAIKFLVSHWYEHREPIVDGIVTKVPLTLEALFAGDALKGFA